MKRFFKQISFFFLAMVISPFLGAQDIDINKKIIIEDNDDIRPIKPYANECCYKNEFDLVPSTDRKSGHLNTKAQRIGAEVPRDDNRLKEGSTLKGYDVVEKTGQSKMRASNPELKLIDTVPHESQTRLVAPNDEPRVMELIPREAKVFIRKVKTQEIVKIPSTQRVNGEGKFGRYLEMQIPRDQNPLKNGSMQKGYDWIFSVEYFGKMLDFEGRISSEVPREPFMSNRGKNEVPVEPVPASKNGFLDCR